jgi:hypothetical protein
MFKIFRLGDWSGVNGSKYVRFTPDGLEAIRFREAHGLPVKASGVVGVAAEEIADRRAAESWPEALQYDACLPLVSCRESGSEFAAMIAAGVFASSGPATVDTEPQGRPVIGLSYRCVVSPFELVQWRRAYAAEQEVQRLKKEILQLEERVKNLVECLDPETVR